MARIYNDMTELIGGTPLVKLGNYAQKHKLNAELLGKLECFNPAGSAKDRIAKSMIEDAEARGLLRPDPPLSSRPAAIPASDWRRWLPPGVTVSS